MSIWKIEKILLWSFVLMLVLAFSNVQSLKSDDFEDILFASLVKKYKDGYLISILPKTSRYDFKELEKYLERIPKEHKNEPFLPIDKQDYTLIENKYNFHLDDEISIFGSWYYGNYVTKGEKYYLQYDDIGTHPVIEDILVFVKGSEKLDKIMPVWAKNHQTYDKTFKWSERGPIENSGNKNTDLLLKIHKIVLNKLNSKAKDQALNLSVINELSEYKEDVYEVNLLPEFGKNYLVIVNGLSLIKNFKFCLGLLIDDNFNIVEEVITPIVFKTDVDYYDCSFKLDHIYYSNELNRDIIIGTYRYGMGGRVYLLLGEKGKIKKVTILSWHGC